MLYHSEVYAFFNKQTKATLCLLLPYGVDDTPSHMRTSLDKIDARYQRQC